MPGGTKSYKTKGGVYEIPDDKSQAFLKDNPDAKEINSYTMGKDTFDIPVNESAAFLKDNPNAQPLKKNESGGTTSQEPSYNTPKGFSTLKPYDKGGKTATEAVDHLKKINEPFAKQKAERIKDIEKRKAEAKQYKDLGNTLFNQDELSKPTVADLDPIEQKNYNAAGGMVADPSAREKILGDVIEQRKSPMQTLVNAGDFYKNDSEALKAAGKPVPDNKDANTYFQTRRESINSDISVAQKNYDVLSANYDGADGIPEEVRNQLAGYKKQIADNQKYLSTFNKYAKSIYGAQLVSQTPVPENKTPEAMSNYYRDIGVKLSSIDNKNASEEKLKNITGGTDANRDKELVDMENYRYETEGLNTARNAFRAQYEAGNISKEDYQSKKSEIDLQESKLFDLHPEAKKAAQFQALGQILQNNRKKRDESGKNGNIAFTSVTPSSLFENLIYSGYSDAEIKRAGDEAGLSTEEIKDAINRKDDIPGTSFFGNIYNKAVAQGSDEVVEPLESLVTKGRLRTDAEVEKQKHKTAGAFTLANEQGFEQPGTVVDTHPKILDENDQSPTYGDFVDNPNYLKDVNNPLSGQHNWGYGALNRVGDATAGLAKLLVITEATGGAGDLLLGGRIGADVVGVVNEGNKLKEVTQFTAQQKNLFGNVVGLTLTGYDDNKEAAKEFIGEEQGGDATRSMFAITRGMETGLLFGMGFSPQKLISKALGAEEKQAAKTFAELIPKDGGIAAMKPETFSSYLKNSMAAKILTSGAKENVKATAMMSLDKVADMATQAMFNPQSVKDKNVGHDLLQEGVQNFLTFAPISFFGAGVHTLNSKHDGQGKLEQEAIYRMGKDPIGYQNYVNQEVKKGNIKQSDANGRIKLVNEMAKLQNDGNIPQNLSRGEKIEYANNLLHAKYLKEEIDKVDPLNETVIKKKTEQLKELQTRRDEIVEKSDGTEKDADGKPIIKPAPVYKIAGNEVTKTEFEDAIKSPDAKEKLADAEVIGDDYMQAELKALGDTKDGTSTEVSQLKPTVSEKVDAVIPAETMTAVSGTLAKVNNAEPINEKEISEAENHLYSALDAAPEAAHLIEPLILKLQDYEHTTKTETRTVTEKEPTGTTAKVKREIKPALEQSEGSEATVTLPDGGVRRGTLSIKSGQYVLDIPNAPQVIIGEKAITDRDLKLPDETRVPNPIGFDKNSNVESVTFETRDGNLVTIHDPEKALDIAIQLQADAIGEIPDAAFDEIYKEVEKQVQAEVPAKDISSQKSENEKEKTGEKTDAQKGNVNNESGAAQKPVPDFTGLSHPQSAGELLKLGIIDEPTHTELVKDLTGADELKKESAAEQIKLLKDEAINTATKIEKPLSEDAAKSEGSGDKKAIRQGTDGDGQGGTDGKTTVLAIKPETDIYKEYNESTDKSTTGKGKAEFKKGVDELEKNTGENVVRTIAPIDNLSTTENIYGLSGEKDLSKYENEIKSGVQAPITVEFNGESFDVMDGHHRLEAYKKLGYKEVPIVVNESGDFYLVAKKLGVDVSKLNEMSPKEIEQIRTDIAKSKEAPIQSADGQGNAEATVTIPEPKVVVHATLSGYELAHSENVDAADIEKPADPRGSNDLEMRKELGKGNSVITIDEVQKDGSKKVSVNAPMADNFGREGASVYDFEIPKESNATAEGIKDIIQDNHRAALSGKNKETLKGKDLINDTVKKVKEYIKSEGNGQGNANMGDAVVETDKAVMQGAVADHAEISDVKVPLPEKGFIISDVTLKDGNDKGKGSGQELYKKALDEHGVLYSFHPVSEDAMRVQDKLVEKGIAKIENITLPDGTEVRKITPTSTPTELKGNTVQGDNKNSLTLPKIESDANDIITGKKVFERFSPQEQRGIAEGGQIHAEASLILAGKDSPNEQAKSTNEEQEKSIEQFAKDKGVWVENVNDKYGAHHNSGEEAIVWNEGDKVIKAQNTFQYEDLQQKLDSITLHNAYFPEAPIKVVGFGKNADGDFQVIVEQPFIEADKTAKVSREEISNYLNNLGFKEDENGHFSNGQTIIEDVHTGNAIKTPEGNIIVIDPIMRLNTPEQGYGGERKISNNISSSKTTDNGKGNEAELSDSKKTGSTSTDGTKTGSGDTGKEPPKEEGEPIDEDSPLEVSLQRDALMEQVQEAFFKPSDGTKSISDKEVFTGAVNTLAREAKKENKSVKNHLKDKVDYWYNRLFNEDGSRIKDANGRDRQFPLTDEQQAMLAIHLLDVKKDIRDQTYNPASPLDAAEIDKLERQQLKAQNIAAVGSETGGRALRFFGQVYKMNNDAEIELARKYSAQAFGEEIPLEQDKFDEFAKGLTTKQRKSAEYIRNALLKYKEKIDASNTAWDKSGVLTAEEFDKEVHRQVQEHISGAIAEAKKEWSAESKAASAANKTTDSKGRVVKEKAAAIADKMNEFADRLGGKGLTMGSVVGPAQIAAKWIIKGIAEGIRQGGKIPELIEKYLGQAKLKDEFKGFDEDAVREEIKSSLKDAGIDEKISDAKPQSVSAIEKIKESAKNSNVSGITKDVISKGIVKDLFHSLGEQGVPVDKIAERAAELLKQAGIDTDAKDLNEAYLGRGKHQLNKRKELETEVEKTRREITEHEKLQHDISEIDKKIKEVEDNGVLSLPKKDEKIQNLNAEKKKKLDQFKETLRAKGIKLESGSKYSRQQKESVIDSHNQAAEALGNKITNLLDDSKNEGIQKLSEGTKNFLRDLKRKLTHTVNAHSLESQMDQINANTRRELNDFEDKHFTVDKRANKDLNGIREDLTHMINNLAKNREKAAEDIKLTDYKKRLETEKAEFQRKLAAGEWDDTHLKVDVKKDADAYNAQIEKDKAKFEFYRAQKAALEDLQPGWIKALKGVRELTRNLLLSGVTGIQAKLGASALTRQFQPLSKLIGRKVVGDLIGIKSFRTKTDASTEWRALSETVLGKTEKQGQAILEKSGEKLDATLDAKNKTEEKYRELVKDHGVDSKEAMQYKINELQKATADYEAAALEHSVNDMYNHITPLNKGGRWIILKEGITREEQEQGMLGKKETLRDYLKTDFEKLSDEDATKEYKKGLNALTPGLKKAAKAAIFYSKWIVRSHGVWKDIPARHELVKGYINRLKNAQANGEDISDFRVKSRLWSETVGWDMQEAKFQDKNKAVDVVRKTQGLLSGEGWLKDGNAKTALKTIVESATPVLKVPANIYNAALQYNLGVLTGSIRILHALYKAHGMDMPLKEYAATHMTEQQKYNIQTAIGRGSVGLAGMIWAYYATKNGSLVMGGNFPDPKRKVTLADGSEVQLDYGDIVINGHMMPHIIARALEHLPTFFPAVVGSDAASSDIEGIGKKDPHHLVDAWLSAGEKAALDAPVISSFLERGVNKYGDDEVTGKNPWAYLGYFGAAKDIEKISGAEQRAPDYLLTPPERFFNKSGLIFWVPTKEEAQDRKDAQENLMKDAAKDIKLQHPELFKEKKDPTKVDVNEIQKKAEKKAKKAEASY